MFCDDAPPTDVPIGRRITPAAGVLASAEQRVASGQGGVREDDASRGGTGPS